MDVQTKKRKMKCGQKLQILLTIYKIELTLGLRQDEMHRIPSIDDRHSIFHHIEHLQGMPGSPLEKPLMQTHYRGAV